MRPLVLVNASAGTAAQYAGRDLPARLKQAFAQAGLDPEIHKVKPRDLDRALQQARAAGGPVVIAGGDGSVSAAVQRFAGTGVPLGVLPFGTYNLLANDLGMSADMDEAAWQIAQAEVRRVDLGLIGGRYFHTLAGLGYFSRVARERARLREALPGFKMGAAALAAIQSFMTGGSLDVEVDDGSRRKGFRTPAILITNNLLDAGSWRRQRLDAGMFEINIVRGDVPFPLLRGGFAALRGAWRESTDIETWTAPRLTLHFRRPRVFLNLDGELLRPRTPLQFAMAPRALTVLTPAGARIGAAAEEVAAEITLPEAAQSFAERRTGPGV